MGRRRRQGSALSFIIVFALLAVTVFALVERNIRPTLLALAEARAKILAVQAINDAIAEET
ncbi:MAG: sporulation protein YunB, partial [Firmicutes bacterium]|nr:sporulation protein YunB [Bacillota bacterium]